jgi:hypothetical protein
MTRNVLLLSTVFLIACGKAPTVSVFTAAPATIAPGASATLVFAAEGADKLTLEPGAGDVTGRTQVEVQPGETTTYTLTASNRSGSTTRTVTVTVGPTPATGFKLSAAGPITAGTPADLTVTAVDPSGATVPSYTGTVHLVSNDAAAELPADFTFTAADNGVKTVPVTFRTAGPRLLVASGTVGGMQGSSVFTVSAAAAAGCAISDVPATAIAGTWLPVRVMVRDAFANIAASYSGTVSLTSTDKHPSASMPEAAAYVPAGDQGSRLFGARLVSAGGQTITAADATGAWSCTASVTINPATPRIRVTLPTDANAGHPVEALVSVQDTYGNPIPYAGTLTFRSTDRAATLPGDLILTGSESGGSKVRATFNTLGAQQLEATLVGGTLSGAGAVTVHGFVFTDPTPGMGKVRLVVNTAASSASVVQLDLVSNTTVTATASSGTFARGGAYSAGMNLPLDNTRVEADTRPLVEGNAFNLGAEPKAVAVALPASGPTAGVLYTGVSQKFDGAGKAQGDVTVLPGRVFYSVRLKLPATASVGTVFDGLMLDQRFRAAVRSRNGDEVLSTQDFAIGKLEIR